MFFFLVKLDFQSFTTGHFLLDLDILVANFRGYQVSREFCFVNLISFSTKCTYDVMQYNTLSSLLHIRYFVITEFLFSLSWCVCGAENFFNALLTFC